MKINQCAQCPGVQIIGADGVGRDLNGVPTPMLHQATRGIHSTADDMVSHHLDCLPHEIEQAHRERHGTRIDAAKSGVRGEQLLGVADDFESGFDADDPAQHDAWVKKTRGEK